MPDNTKATPAGIDHAEVVEAMLKLSAATFEEGATDIERIKAFRASPAEVDVFKPETSFPLAAFGNGEGQAFLRVLHGFLKKVYQDGIKKGAKHENGN